MINRLPIAVVLAVGTLPAAAAAQISPSWDGNYPDEWSGGRIAGGTGIVIAYALHLGRDGYRSHAEGWQADETIRCTAVPHAGVIDIRLKSDGDGDGDGQVANKYGVVQFKPGERPFSLSNRRGVIWTGRGSYSLWENKQPLGRHFRSIG